MSLDLTPLSESSEALVALAEDGFTHEFISPGTIPSTSLFPDGVISCSPTQLCGPGVLVGSGLENPIYPAENFIVPQTGMFLVPITADAQTLTTLQEE